LKIKREVKMENEIRTALKTDRVIDITTIGRKTGKPRRLEIWFHNLDGELFLTGSPGRKRDWLANLIANPEFTFHLKQSLQADIPARAMPIFDEPSRREILSRLLEKMGGDRDLEAWVKDSPLVKFELAIERFTT
jgi:deazaflavin-dependent oxidoreductase (nitroreductase family)